jgi:Domain of unknown function (DUF4186)
MPAQPEPLKVSCGDSSCDENLHCFRPRSDTPAKQHGHCRDCGADLVDWETLHQRDLDQIDALFAELPKELIRHHYWHTTIPEAVLTKARRYRPEVIAKRTTAAIHSRVGPASSAIFRDGTQTPDEYSENAQIYFLGMHAVAVCCRKCMEYWHGIPREQPLTVADEQYFSELVWAYVCQRMDWPEYLGLIHK